MKYRIITKTLKKALKTFPAVVITGPRQSGKTTLLRTVLKTTHDYVSLEDIDVRSRAKEDPRGFLEQYIKKPVILDEIQYVPELLSYIKTAIDNDRKPGKWVLTGSQNFSLMHGVTQSLAGRAAVLTLLPFSLAERINKGEKSLSVSQLLNRIKTDQKKNKRESIAEIILRGNYPEIASNKKVDKDLWCSSYINTYLERDIRNITQVGDLNQFERFLRLCATRTGQILNISDLARDIGISVPTAKKWLSLLEAGYQVFLLYPYYKNIGKRVIKSPKLYFNDTALAAYLLGLDKEKTLLNSSYFGSLFETLIVTDFWKRFLNFGQMPSLYYLRTKNNLEIDIILEIQDYLNLIEIKSSSTIASQHAASLNRAKKDFSRKTKKALIISQSKDNFVLLNNVQNYNWFDILSL